MTQPSSALPGEDEARVLVLYCGGTIGMLKSPSGYVPHSGFLASNLRSQSRFHDPEQDSVFANSDSVAAFSTWSLGATAKANSGSSTPLPPPVLTAVDLASCIAVRTESGDKLLPSLVTPRSAQGKRIRYVIHEYDVLIDSSEVELSDWIKIASDIERNYHLFDSFVLLHGTDTMAYTASALSFLLEDLGKTVIITGAQIPLSELFNDSIDNLLGALIVAGHFLIPEVSLFFNHKLLRGNRSIKASSDEFDAFASPSLAPLATVGIEIEVAWGTVLQSGPRAFRAHKSLSGNVATLRVFPGISGSAVRAFLNAGDIRGVVLESYGAGNAPRREELLSAFREAADREVVIVNVSQCATGAVAPDTYETGRILAAVGIIGGADMTVECALAKLSYLLSKPELSPAQVRKLIALPLRGELTLASPIPNFSSPIEGGDRLRALFAQVVACAPPITSTNRPVPERSYSTSGSDFVLSSTGETLPPEFASPWPANPRDLEVAEKAILPFLLGQAAARSGPSLSLLIDSLASPSSSNTVDLHPTALTILNEPSTASLHTPLHLAALSAQLPNVLLLLSHGASVHVRDVLSHSPLFYAARIGGSGLDMVGALRAAGAHLGEAEMERGDVGLEVSRAERSGDEERVLVWKEAAGPEDLERAKESLRRLVGAI